MLPFCSVRLSMKNWVAGGDPSELTSVMVPEYFNVAPITPLKRCLG